MHIQHILLISNDNDADKKACPTIRQSMLVPFLFLSRWNLAPNTKSLLSVLHLDNYFFHVTMNAKNPIVEVYE